MGEGLGHGISQKASRRQDVISAGSDYDTKHKEDSNIADDDLENIGRIIDYSGKIVEKGRQPSSEYKDTQAFSKDVIERIKSLQDSIFKRTGNKELAEKLKLMLPDIKDGGKNKVKNATSPEPPKKSIGDSSHKSSDTQDSRSKIIPEDVVDKIIQKFQELREQAKNLAQLEKKKKDEEDSEKASKAAAEAPKPPEAKNPYASIGPTKDNEEMKNISSTTEAIPTSAEVPSSSHDSREFGSNQEIMQAPNSGGIMSFQGPNNRAASTGMIRNLENPGGGNMNAFQGLMMSNAGIQGGLPLMFVKTGQMLVPVFGEPNGATAPAPGQILANTATSFIQTPPESQTHIQPLYMPHSQMEPFGMPQSPAYEEAASRSIDTTSGYKTIPSVPLSMIQSLMAGPNSGLLNNIPAMPSIPPQMNGGLYNAMTSDNSGQQLQQQNLQETSPFQRSMESTQSDQHMPLIAPEISGIINEIEKSPSMNVPGPNMMETPNINGQRPNMMQSPNMNGRHMNMMESPNVNGQQPNMMESPTINGQLPNMIGSPAKYGQKPNMMDSSENTVPGQSSMMLVPQSIMQGQLKGNNDVQQDALAMNPAGQISPFNAISQAGIAPPNPKGPLASNPHQEVHPEAQNNMELMNREQQMLNPQYQAPINDLSDPVPGINAPNVNPDSLLEVARYRSTEEALNPQMVSGMPVSKLDPESLLDNVQGRTLRRGLLGAGDPSKFSQTDRDDPGQRNSPFANTSPDGLLEFLTKGNSRGFKKHLQEGILDTEPTFNQRDIFDIPGFQSNNGYYKRKSHRNYRVQPERQEPGISRGGIQAIDTNGMQSAFAFPNGGGSFFSSRERQEPEMIRGIQDIGINGMQSAASFPVGGSSFLNGGGFGGIDPSVADVISANRLGGQQIDIERKSSAADNTVGRELSTPQFSDPLGQNSVSVLRGNDLQYEQSRNSIDSNHVVRNYFEEQAQARQHISKPTDRLISKKSQTKSLLDDNIEIKVNGQELADKGSLRSKIINGKVIKGKGKTLTSKGPVRIELSHSDDNKKTKIVNIITSTKYNVTDTRRDKIFAP